MSSQILLLYVTGMGKLDERFEHDSLHSTKQCIETWAKGVYDVLVFAHEEWHTMYHG